jgi:hypothetical protein
MDLDVPKITFVLCYERGLAIQEACPELVMARVFWLLDLR